MSAVVITRAYPIPRDASFVERSSLRLAEIVARWATHRAEIRQERRTAMLETIRQEQTRTPDPRAADHMLARMGAPGR